MKQIVVAYERNRGIGAENDLLWLKDLPADLKHFRDITMDTSLVMGRKTFESIGHALPGRQNIVVSHTPVEIEGVESASSLEEAFDLAVYPTISVMGGGSIYAQAIDLVDVIYATEVAADFPQAEIFFPELGDEWMEASREHHEADEQNKYAYDFVEYVRAI